MTHATYSIIERETIRLNGRDGIYFHVYQDLTDQSGVAHCGTGFYPLRPRQSTKSVSKDQLINHWLDELENENAAD